MSILEQESEYEYYVLITSLKTKTVYRIDALKSYKVEATIDVPADYFDFTVGNYNGEVTNVISAGDELKFYAKGEQVMVGNIDDITPEYSPNSSDVRIVGRDKMAVLLDNDALPKTYYNLSLKDYLKKVLPKYGITKYECSSPYKFKKIVVSPGESEYSVIERLAKERGLTVFFDSYGVLKVTSLRADKEYDYYFTNDTEESYIRIKDAAISVSNDIKNEVIVYGEKKKKSYIKGSYKDSSLKTRKRRVLNEPDIETTADANRRAKEEFINLNKNAFSITINTRTRKPIRINKIAKVRIDRLDLNCIVYIDAVEYTKDTNSGSNTRITLKLVQGVKVTFNNSDIPLLPTLSQTKDGGKEADKYPGAAIKMGARGEDVKRIQKVVGVKVDGVFGPSTKKAVVLYQKKHKIKADGVVGKKTWDTMF